MSLCWGLKAKERHDGRALMMALDRYDMISLHIINCPRINRKEKVQPQIQSTTRGTLQTFVSHLSTNSSYYCYCGETENLLIQYPFLTRDQNHLKAIDCGFKSQARRASFTASWNNLYWPTETKSRGPGVVSSGKMQEEATVQLKVHAVCAFIILLASEL